MSTKKKSTASAVQEPAFPKVALVNCNRFRDERDIVSALLEDDVEYTIPEVEAMIMEYMKGKVK